MDKKNANYMIASKASTNVENEFDPGTINRNYVLGSSLLEANKLCVSIWPILFGAIVAQSLRMLAAFRVERASGMALVQLEQLVGSHSLATAIKQPFMMMHMDLTSVGMICLWALSPIAGQSFLRMLTVESQSTMTSTASVSFANFSKPLDGIWNTTDDSATAAINLLFATALLATPNYGSGDYSLDNDPWNQPLMALAAPPKDPNSYFDYGDIPYALVGQSIYGVVGYNPNTEDSQNVTFTIPTAWFAFQCMDPVNRTLEGYSEDWSLNYTDWFFDEASTMFVANVVPGNNQSITTGSQPAKLFLAMNHTREDNYTLFTPTTSVWQCGYFTQYASVDYTCVDYSTNCSVAGESQGYGFPHLESNSTNLYLTEEFLDSWIYSLGVPDSFQDTSNSSRQSNSSTSNSSTNSSNSSNSSYWDDDYQYDQYKQRSLLAQLIIDPDWLNHQGNNPQPYNITGSMIQQKLTSMITAYWQLGFTYTALELSSAQSTANTTHVPNLSNLKVSVFDSNAKYVVHWQWLTVLICSCVLLLAFGITGIILDSRTIGPDILGFASSMTRDNRYIKLEDEAIELDDEAVEGGASTKNSYQTIHDLKYHRVMLQDVHGDANVGKVALGSVGLQHGKPLSRDRLYR